MAVGVVNLFPLQQLHSLSSNCHCFCAFFFSIKDLCLRVFYISYLPRLLEAPFPRFCSVELIFSYISPPFPMEHLSDYLSSPKILKNNSLLSSTLIAPCHVTHCHKRNSASIASIAKFLDLPRKPLLLWYMGGFFGTDVFPFLFAI